MEKLEVFGRRLRQLRTEKGLSQKEMAKSIDITSASLSAYENGTKNPSLGVAISIAEKYHVSLDWLSGADVVKNDAPGIHDYESLLLSLFKLTDNENIVRINIQREDGSDFPNLDIISESLRQFIINTSRASAMAKSEAINHKEFEELLLRFATRYANLLYSEVNSVEPLDSYCEDVF